MKTKFDFDEDIDIAWCPGCGDYSILNILKSALTELEILPENMVLVSGIGQAAKVPQYMNTNFFNGLHGRAMPVATAVKASNPGLTVIAVSGDGCTYGEGGNHFIHGIRRNPDITMIVHNNMVYGLTKGQASPTSHRGFKTPVQPAGVYLEPFNPLAVAISLEASFVARGCAVFPDETKEIVKKAVAHHGFSLVDIFQNCVTFNRTNTFQWYKEHTYFLEGSHDARDRERAMHLAMEKDRYPLGILYLNDANRTFEENLAAYAGDARPLYQRTVDRNKLQELLS